MSFAKISTESINTLVTKARVMKSPTSKGSHIIKINGHDCEVKNGQLNLINLAQIFNIDHNNIKQWKTKNAAYLTKMFGEQVKKNKSDNETKSKPIMDNGATYIDPRFAIQCLMGSNIDFNNFITSIVLSSLLYYSDSSDNNLSSIYERLEEDIPEIQKELEQKCTSFKSESTKDQKKHSDVNKIMVIAFPSDTELNTPFIKFFNSDKLSDTQINKLKKRGQNNEAYKLVKIEFTNNPKLKEAVEKYLVDEEIKHETSNIQITLTNNFTEEYYKSIKNEMYNSINTTMEKLYNENKQETETRKTKRSSTKQPKLDIPDEIEEEKTKPNPNKKNVKKGVVKKNKIKEEVIEEEKPKSRSNSSNRVTIGGKFTKFSINDTEAEDFEFSDDDM